MENESEDFEWLDVTEAEQMLRRRIAERETPDSIDLTVIGRPGSAREHELLATRDQEPRHSVNNYLKDTEQHFTRLWVGGDLNFTDEEIQQLGPYLVRSDAFREDAVFQILARRRADAPDYMRRFITVNKEHILQYGLGSQAGRISLEGIQKANTAAAWAQLQPLVEANEFEDTFLCSDIMRRVLRAVHYILSEPTDSSALLLERFKRQVNESQPLSAQELVARTYNFTNDQYKKHIKTIPNKIEIEESLIQLLEEGRLKRLSHLGNAVLVSGLGIISAGEYKDN